MPAEFENGTLGSFEATRVAPGRKNYNYFEIYGSKGSLIFDLERMNELQFFSNEDPDDSQGFRTILATEPSHAYVENWWPPGHIIGYVVLVKSLTRGPSTPRRWQYDIEKSNGPLAEVNSHDIDMLRWFTGSEFKEVYAIAGNYRCPEARDAFPDFYDNVILSARFVNGMQGFIDGAVSVGYGYDARVEILGTEGVMFVGRLEENSVVTCRQTGGMIKPVIKNWRDLFMEAYLLEDTDFIHCIVEDREPAVTGIDGKMAVMVVNAGNQSIREKRPVSVCAEADGKISN
jgi:predicted dehydrogenase